MLNEAASMVNAQVFERESWLRRAVIKPMMRQGPNNG